MKRILLLLAFSLLVVSCDYVEALKPEPKITFGVDVSQGIMVKAEGGTTAIPLESNGRWRASSYPTSGVEFISMTGSFGDKGSGSLEFKAKPNLMTQFRSAAISLSCENEKGIQTYTIEVIQEPAEPMAIIPDWQELTVPAEGGSFTVKIEANCKWGPEFDSTDASVAEIKDFVYESPGEPYTYELTVSVAKNPGTERRTFRMDLTTSYRGTRAVSSSYTFYQAG